MGANDKSYEERVIRVTELVGIEGLLEGFSFTKCHIQGPAILVLQGGTLTNSDLGGPTPDAVLWEVDPKRGAVVGAILAKECSFDSCEFRNIGFAGPPDFIAQMKVGVGT